MCDFIEWFSTKRTSFQFSASEKMIILGLYCYRTRLDNDNASDWIDAHIDAHEYERI